MSLIKPKVEAKDDMYSHQSFDLINYVLSDQPVESVEIPITETSETSESSELVMPARRPTAVPMISNKRKVSARITRQFSPYMLNHLHQVM